VGERGLTSLQILKMLALAPDTMLVCDPYTTSETPHNTSPVLTKVLSHTAFISDWFILYYLFFCWIYFLGRSDITFLKINTFEYKLFLQTNVIISPISQHNGFSIDLETELVAPQVNQRVGTSDLHTRSTLKALFLLVES